MHIHIIYTYYIYILYIHIIYTYYIYILYIHIIYIYVHTHINKYIYIDMDMWGSSSSMTWESFLNLSPREASQEAGLGWSRQSQA